MAFANKTSTSEGFAIPLPILKMSRGVLALGLRSSLGEDQFSYEPPQATPPKISFLLLAPNVGFHDDPEAPLAALQVHNLEVLTKFRQPPRRWLLDEMGIASIRQRFHRGAGMD